MNKKGISVVSLSVTIVILLVIVSTISVSISYSVANAKKLTFAKEIYNIQSLVTEYMQKENVFPVSESTIQIQPSNTEQFAEEEITDGKLSLNVLDLKDLGIVNSSYGNKELGENDVYAVSQKGKVYYVAGFKSEGKTYYTLTEDLLNMIDKKQQLIIGENTILFMPSKLGWTNEAISVKVAIPDDYEVTSFVINNTNVSYTTEEGTDVKYYNINTNKVLENYTITVDYVKDSVNGTVTYSTKLDTTAPTIIKDSTIKNTSTAIKGLTAIDNESGIKSFKYIEGIVNDSNEHIEQYGKKVNKRTIKMKNKTVYTLYAVDKAGNYFITNMDEDGNLGLLENITVNGTNRITISNISRASIVNYRIYGNSIQGHNLFNVNNFIGLSDNSNYYSTNNNGEIIQKASDYRDNSVLPTVFTLKPGEYKVTGINTTNYRFYNKTSNEVISLSNNIFTITNTSEVAFKSWEAEGTNIGKIEVKQIPTSNSPIEIESVGNKRKNFFDISKVLSSSNGKIVNNDNKSISIYGNAFPGAAPYTLKDYCPELEIGKTYIFSAKHDIETEAYRRIYLMETGVSWRFDTNSDLRTLTITQEHLDSQVLWYKDADKEYNTVWDIQVEEVTDGEGIEEVQYDYIIPIKIGSKNLLNINNRTISNVSIQPSTFVDFSVPILLPDYASSGYNLGRTPNVTISENTITWKNNAAWYGIGISFKPEKGVSYNLSYESNSSERIYQNVVYYSDGYYTRSDSSNIILLEDEETDVIISFRTAEVGTFSVSNLQIEEGTKATAYESYHEPITTNIYLKEPLRKIGDYADYIDFETGKVVRKIYKAVPYTSGYKNGSSYANGLCRYQYGVSPAPNYDVAPMSNCLLGHTGKIVSSANNITFNSTYTNAYMYFNCSDIGIEVPEATTTNTENGTSIKNYIDKKGIYIYYVLREEILEDIELPDISLNQGTNIIEIETNVEPSNTEVTYIRK